MTVIISCDSFVSRCMLYLIYLKCIEIGKSRNKLIKIVFEEWKYYNSQSLCKLVF